jgi:hypothetical protein
MTGPEDLTTRAGEVAGVEGATGTETGDVAEAETGMTAGAKAGAGIETTVSGELETTEGPPGETGTRGEATAAESKDLR